MEKQHRLPFPNGTTVSTSSFQLLHIDVWGPFNTPTYDGHKFFVTIVDDCTRLLWLFLVRMKSDVCVVLKNCFILVKTQFNNVVKIVRTDSGSEFVNAECHKLFRSLGIIIKVLAFIHLNINCITERKHKHILEVSRAIRFQGHIPIRFCGDCIPTIAYIINLVPTPVLHGKSLHEVFHKTKPTLQHLRVLGCLYFAKIMYIHDKF